jgi:sterol-4alpha-carboxylate 3-dehydrogenase (decarboxylating)
MIMGDGKNCDDFVYVENVVHGHLCAEKTLSTKEGAKRSGGKVCIYCDLQNNDSCYSLLTCLIV